MAKIGENVKISIKIAVTGEVASGKSTVCRYFQDFKAYIVNADKLVHALLSSNKAVIKKIIDYFGEEIMENGKISKDKLAHIVFNDKKKLIKLENMIHPILLQKIDKLYVKVKDLYEFFVVEIPLVFKLKIEDKFDYIILVIANKYIRKQRFKKKYFEKRTFPTTRNVDFIINNEYSLFKLKTQVKDIVLNIRSNCE